MRCLVVAMTLVASTVLVHGQHWTPLARRGDPDIQGYWPGVAMLGVPLERPASLGDKATLTDEEFAQLLEKRRLTNANDAFFGESRDHWRDYGKPQRQTSLLVDPPNGSSSVDGRGRETDRGDSQRSARTTERPRERWSARPVHLTRRFRIDDAHWQLERQPDHPGTWPRRDPQRDDPRGARRLPRWATARWCRHRRVHG